MAGYMCPESVPAPVQKVSTERVFCSEMDNEKPVHCGEVQLGAQLAQQHVAALPGLTQSLRPLSSQQSLQLFLLFSPPCEAMCLWRRVPARHIFERFGFVSELSSSCIAGRLVAKLALVSIT